MLRALFGMMSLRDWGLFTLLFSLLLAVGLVRADDIPDNCESPGGVYYRQELFPRYESQNRRLVLVNWNSGAEEAVLATDLDAAQFQVTGWSPDCRYIAGAVEKQTDDPATKIMDTVVWDVVNSQRIGSVPDAHGHPHHITWGPDEFLVVETRNGAILWNVPANTQTTLTTSWDSFSTRNFSRLRWDKTNHQLIANFAVGGRAVYDLLTGQELPLAANTLDLTDPGQNEMVVVGGRAYPCKYYSSIFPTYDRSLQRVIMVLYGGGHWRETIAVLEEGVNATRFQFRGWSSSCRYVAASLGTPGKIRVTDTVVWDIVEGRRVGAFEDAREIVHPLYWSPSDDALVIETRDGAYLWYLPTDTRALISSETRAALAGYVAIDNFEDLKWNADAHQVLIQPLGTAEWIAFDVRTGQPVTPILPPEPAPYQPPTTSRVNPTPITGTPIDGISGWGTWSSYQQVCADFVFRNSGDDSSGMEIVNLQTGEVVSTLQGDGKVRNFSPDCRHVFGEQPIFGRDNIPYDDRPLDDTPRERRSTTVIIWDAYTGQRLLELLHPYRFYSRARVDWSPGSDRALIRTTSGYFLWNSISNQSVLLIYTGIGSSIRDYYNSYWDYEHGMVWINTWSGVIAFDMQTGLERYRRADFPVS